MFFSREWLCTTIEEFVAALDAYIRWYNDVRIKISLGFRSPVEHRRSLGIAAEPVQVFGRTPLRHEGALLVNPGSASMRIAPVPSSSLDSRSWDKTKIRRLRSAAAASWSSQEMKGVKVERPGLVFEQLHSPALSVAPRISRFVCSGQGQFKTKPVGRTQALNSQLSGHGHDGNVARSTRCQH